MEYREKLNDKIKALNSTRVFKKITPKGDLSWYVKWVSVVLIVIATAARSQGGIPHIDLWFGLVGTLVSVCGVSSDPSPCKPSAGFKRSRGFNV